MVIKYTLFDRHKIKNTTRKLIPATHDIVANNKSDDMKIQKINLSFSGYTDSGFEQKAQHILASMTSNPFFPTPVPPLGDVEDAIADYSADLLAAATLDRTAVAKKNGSRQVLRVLLRQLGMYVMYIANGDVAILTSSGYTLSRQPELNYITNPGNVTLSNGVTSGQLQAAVKTVRGAKGYQYQIAEEEPTAETNWVSTSSSRSRFTFTNLLPGKRYWVRVAATGAGEQIAYSPVASQFVQ